MNKKPTKADVQRMARRRQRWRVVMANTSAGCCSSSSAAPCRRRSSPRQLHHNRKLQSLARLLPADRLSGSWCRRSVGIRYRSTDSSAPSSGCLTGCSCHKSCSSHRPRNQHPARRQFDADWLHQLSDHKKALILQGFVQGFVIGGEDRNTVTVHGACSCSCAGVHE